MGAGAAAVYVWEDPGDSIMIQLSLDVVDRLSAAIERGLGSGDRGIEVGGILLGRLDPSGGRALLIEDFELVPCEHARGASYTLSRDDLATLGAHLEQRRRNAVVGYFRSHTRPGMYVDQDDFAIISSYFPDSSQVFLLVKPSPEGSQVGGFFFWEEGDMNRKAPYRPFPFNRKKLVEGDFPLADATAVSPRTIAPPPRTRQVLQVSWLAVPLIAGMFLIAGFFVSESRSKPGSSSTSQAATAQPLSLQVLKTSGALELRWDPSSQAIRKASLGILKITDGRRQVRQELDPKALAAGITTYAPNSNDVTVELQVYALTEEVAQSLKGWLPPKPQPVAQVAENTPPPPANPPVPQATADRSLNKLAQPKQPVSKSAVLKAPLPAREPVTVSRVAPSVLTPPPALPVVNPAPQPKLVAMLPPHPASLPPAPEAQVSYNVPHPSVFKRVFHKMKFESTFADFVPPSPTHKVTPRIVPGADVEAPVDVKVYVDETGTVSRAQLLTKESEMSALSLSAARQWHFAPARKHDKPVASEVVLHFHFGGGDI